MKTGTLRTVIVAVIGLILLALAFIAVDERLSYQLDNGPEYFAQE